MPLMAANEDVGAPEQDTGTIEVPLMFQFKGMSAAPAAERAPVSPAEPQRNRPANGTVVRLPSVAPDDPGPQERSEGPEAASGGYRLFARD